MQAPVDAASYLAYLDSFLSKSSVQPHSYSSPTSPRPVRIEDVLMQRHRVAQSHLYTLKAHQQNQELREMRPVPKINPLSKRLAKVMQRPPLVPEKDEKRGTAKEAEGEKGLGEARSEARIAPPPLELRCHVSLESGTISPVIPTVKTHQGDNLRFPTQSGILSLEALRSRVLEKYENSELLEPPPDLLDMEVLERQQYFTERKEQKLKKKRLLKAQAETRQCTFRPILNSSRSLTTSRSDHSSRSLSASRSHQRSYYERYVYSKSVKTSLNHTASNIKPASSRAESRKADFPCKAPAVRYQPLSPASPRVAFRSGLNLNAFLATAKPMVSYRDADVEKAKAAPRLSRSKGRF